MNTSKSVPINVALASDQTYYIGLWVTLISLLSNTNTKSVINFFIFDGGINEYSKEKLLKKLKDIKSNISIIWLDPNISLYQDFLAMSNKPSSFLAYSSIIVPDKLRDLDKVIWLDVDLLVLNDIELLWNSNMNGKPIAAVLDIHSDYKNYHDIQNPSKYSIELSTPYYNSGVLLYDIKALNKFHFTKKCLEYLKNEDKKNYKLFDQSAINVVMNNNFHTLNENFNILSSYLMGKCIENNKPEIDLLKNKRYIYHSTIHKQWRTFRPSFHCELFYFF